MRSLLIVDDDMNIRKGLYSMVIGFNLDIAPITMADNGKTAIDIIRSKQPAAVLLDIKMPGMSGLDVLRETAVENGATRYIVLSGYGEFEFAQQAMRYGVSDYLLKPVDRNELRAALRKCYENIPSVLAPPDHIEIDSSKKAVDIVKRYIESHYNMELNLDALAKIAAMHPAYFSVLFKKEEGISLSNYITKLRITRAMELLGDPAVKIHDVGFQTGFHDEKYFSKVFKKVVGITPREFRDLR